MEKSEKESFGYAKKMFDFARNKLAALYVFDILEDFMNRFDF